MAAEVGSESVAVVVAVATGCCLSSRRLNIKRERSTLARLTMINIPFACLVLVMDLHVRHRGRNAARYPLDGNVSVETRPLRWRLTDPYFTQGISQTFTQTSEGTYQECQNIGQCRKPNDTVYQYLMSIITSPLGARCVPKVCDAWMMNLVPLERTIFDGCSHHHESICG